MILEEKNHKISILLTKEPTKFQFSYQRYDYLFKAAPLISR